MQKQKSLFGNVKFSTSIVVMSIGSLAIAMGLVIAVVYTNIAAGVVQSSRTQLDSALRVTTTLFTKGTPGASFEVDENNNITAFNTTKTPKFFNDITIDQITSSTGQQAAFYKIARKTGELETSTSSIVIDEEGTRAVGEILGLDHPIFVDTMAGNIHYAKEVHHGTSYYGAYLPLYDTKKEVYGGVLYVGIESASIDAIKTDTLNLLLIVCGIVFVAVGLFTLVAARRLIRPLNSLAGVMGEVEADPTTAEVPYLKNTNELGNMARAVESFRQNGLKVNNMTDEIRISTERTTADRAEMMDSLQLAFGTVVDAAVHGDFSKRVDDEFPDAALNNLASGINDLVDTVDRGITETGDVLEALAQADLTKRMSGNYEGAFANLKTNTNLVGDRLTEIVGRLRTTSGSLKSATGELLAGANDLGQRTTRQAATIEETTAAMEELTDTVGDNAKQAQEATDKTVTASKLAEEGGQGMAAANQAMERITTSSSKISNIIGMIDDIAFQTNLLALNASVEAARAGEAGKGFAVVAVEVRRLAQSAAEASNEVKVLIEQSGNEVAEGSKLVADASQKLETMMAAVQENSQIMSGISEASREQSSSLDSVGDAVRQMNEMTQHNAALVEETNAVIEQTEGQVSELDQIVELFKLANGQSVSAPQAQSAPAPQRAPAAPAPAPKPSYASSGNAAISEEWSEF